jgi:hypothetical protein
LTFASEFLYIVKSYPMKSYFFTVLFFLFFLIISSVSSTNLAAQDIFMDEVCVCDNGSGMSTFVITFGNWPTDPGVTYEVEVNYSALGGNRNSAKETNVPGILSGNIQLTFSGVSNAADPGNMQITSVTNISSNTEESVSSDFLSYESPAETLINCPADTTVSICQLSGNSLVDVFDTWMSGVSASGGCGAMNVTNDWDGIYPDSCGGSVEVVFTSKDNICLDSAVCSAVFTVEDCIAPVPVVVNGLVSVNVTANQCVDVNVSIFNAGSFDACGEVLLSYSSDLSDTLRTFCCHDGLSAKEVEFWVTDEAGNQDFVVTYIAIRDPNNICSPPGFKISGEIATQDARGVEDVEVFLEDTSTTALIQRMTGISGYYEFSQLDGEGVFRLWPYKNDDVLNGVSTFDILIIQRHILGIAPMSDPYKLIAANVNSDERISGADMIDLRRTILGIDNAFRNNTSWRFVDANEVLQEGEVPSAYAEEIELSVNNNSHFGQDFVAVKIGDVDGSVVPSSLYDPEEEGQSGALIISAEDTIVGPGDLIEIDIKSATFSKVQGYQMTLEYGSDNFDFIDLRQGALNINEGNYGHFAEAGLLTMSWNTVDWTSHGRDEVLFTLVFRAKEAGRLSELLQLSDAITTTQAYIDGAARKLSLQFTQESKEFALYQNVPNPFNTEALIGFDHPQSGPAILTFYNTLGEVAHTIEGDYSKGYNQVRIDREDLPAAGLYFYELRSGDHSTTKKMIIGNK